MERLKHLKAGQNAWHPDLPAHLQLNVKGARLSNIYKRLLPDQPAYTVTGSGGGGTHATTNNAGSAGMPGIVVVEEYR